MQGTLYAKITYFWSLTGPKKENRCEIQMSTHIYIICEIRFLPFEELHWKPSFSKIKCVQIIFFKIYKMLSSGLRGSIIEEKTWHLNKQGYMICDLRFDHSKFIKQKQISLKYNFTSEVCVIMYEEDIKFFLLISIYGCV